MANIVFKDAEVKRICVENWGSNGEITYEQAAAVTGLGRVFRDSTITSFDELIYFTRLDSISSSAFRGCAQLTSIALPPTINQIGGFAFHNDTNLKRVIISDIQAYCNINFSTDTSSPFCYGASIYSDDDTEIKTLEIPEGVETISTYAFMGAAITTLILPSTLTNIYNSSFYGCSSLTSVRPKGTVPATIESDSFQNINNSCALIVPIGTYDAYINAGWTSSVFKGEVSEGNLNDYIISFYKDDSLYSQITQEAGTIIELPAEPSVDYFYAWSNLPDDHIMPAQNLRCDACYFTAISINTNNNTCWAQFFGKDLTYLEVPSYITQNSTQYKVIKLYDDDSNNNLNYLNNATIEIPGTIEDFGFGFGSIYAGIHKFIINEGTKTVNMFFSNDKGIKNIAVYLSSTVESVRVPRYNENSSPFIIRNVQIDFTIDPANRNIRLTDDGVIYSYDYQKLYYFPHSYTGDYSINSATTTIEKDAFTSATLGILNAPNVTIAEVNALHYSDTGKLIFPKLKEAYDQSFYGGGTVGEEYFDLPTPLEVIGVNAFAVSRVRSAIITAGTTVSNSAFSYS